MFGSQKAYGGNNNNQPQHYGNTSYLSSTESNDSFWGNRSNANSNNTNRLNYRDSAPVSAAAIANDSLYGYQANNDSLNHSSSDNIKNDSKYGNLASIVAASGTSSSSKHQIRTTTWASIASQPAKSQPKSLKAKMAAGLTGTTSKHLPPTITMDAMSWDSKNGSLGPSKTIPPPTVPAVVSAPLIIGDPDPPIAPSDDLYSPEEDLPPLSASTNPIHQPQSQQQQPSSQQQSAQVVNRENNWSNQNNGNSSPVGSITNNSDISAPQRPQIPMSRQTNEYHNGNSQQPHYNSRYNQRGNNDYGPPKPPLMDNQYGGHQSYDRGGPPHHNKNIVHHHNTAPPAPKLPPPAVRDLVDDDDDEEEEEEANSVDGINNDLSQLVLEKLVGENNYNPKEFDLNLRNARFFIIKSYSEDDIHRSIKYSIWCSTEHGNKRLDTAYRLQEDKGPIYLFFSVNRSGHFCGVAQMMSPVDYNASSGVWSQDKWKGQFKVKWIYVKDVPNDELRHITLENNENKPVTNSRDTQEVPYEKGKLVINIIHRYPHSTSIFDDFLHYEKKQEEEYHRKPDLNPALASSPPPHVNNNYYPNNKMLQSSNAHPSSYSHHHGPSSMGPPPLRDGPMMSGSGYNRGNNHHNSNYNHNKPRSYNNDRDDRLTGGHRNNDYHRNDYNVSGPPGSGMMGPPRGGGGDNNFRNNSYGDQRQRNDGYHHRDPYYRGGRDGGPDGGGYRGGGGGGGIGNAGGRDYYGGDRMAPPPQRDYPPPPPPLPNNDYRGGGGGGIANHDRIQSWRN